MRKEQSASVDKSRVDMISQMMEYQKERDAQKMKMKQEKREEEKRFRLFSLLINKPSLDEREHGILEELKKEFMHL